MKSRSCKNKGYRLQVETRDKILAALGVSEADVLSRSMGSAGADICLSQAARDKLPIAFECKYTERLEVWDALKQAEANAKKEGLAPCVVFRRNRSETYAILRFDDLLHLLVSAKQKAEGGEQKAESGEQRAERLNNSKDN